jgi:hypothetical protein
VRGADVVVLAGDGDPDMIGRSAPAAVIVVTGEGIEDRCRTVYERLLYPRARIFGIADPARVGAAVEAVAFERDEPHDVIAMRADGFEPCSARLGRGGIRELL